MNADLIDKEDLFIEEAGVDEMIQSMVDSMVQNHRDPQKLVIIGIQQKGVLVADAILAGLKYHWSDVEIASGELDIGMYRDDLNSNPAPKIQPTSVPEHLEDKDVVLVDDVLQSGRTTRAALDALRDFGRPRRIQLAVLFDRGQRQLPIQPDYVGKQVDLESRQFIVVKSLEGTSKLQVYLTLK